MSIQASSWAGNAKRFPMLNEPDPSYHGVVCHRNWGPAAYIGRCCVRAAAQHGCGDLAPMNAFLIMQGLETLGCAWNAIARMR